MLIATLIVLNVPVFLFLGWLIFDTKASAGETFYDTVVAIFKAILKAFLVLRLVLFLMGDDDREDAWGIVPIIGFLLACAAVVYAEHYLITRFLVPGG